MATHSTCILDRFSAAQTQNDLNTEKINKMKTTSPLHSKFYLLPNCTNLNTLIANPTFLIPKKPTSSKNSTIRRQILKCPTSRVGCINLIPRCQKTSNEDVFRVSSNGCSRYVLFGAVSIGFVLVLMGMDEHQKALALGPEGPLVEEFWDNVRRYALYALTVSTGAIYTILLPIVELLKNPISAILLLVILGGGFYIVSQVLSAMVGVSGFTYEYGY